MAKTSRKPSTRKTKRSGVPDAGNGTVAVAEPPGKRSTAGRSARGGGRAGRGGRGGTDIKPEAVAGKQLVIVESPAKAKTINKYLGPDYCVVASIGHVRDLPERNPKGVKSPVPGVDLEHDFRPTYEVLPGKAVHINALKRAAKNARDVWFATDLDREGEAIAWHLAEELGVKPDQAKRVIFAAITKDEIQRAFQNPHAIDMDRVNAQQARRLLDRIVGYQVSPLLWKKVARGLSAGRVQSVAVRLVVEREREIRHFVPDEYWQIGANFALEQAIATKLAPEWRSLLASRDEKDNPPSQKAQLAWLGEHGAIPAELVEVAGEKFEARTLSNGIDNPDAPDLTARIASVAALAGLVNVRTERQANKDGRGPSRWSAAVAGEVSSSARYAIKSIETKRTTTRPAPPFITSTLQQAASTRLGFGARRTMQAAQQLYEGVEIPGEGPVGLITYMRTDSTHLSGQALNMARAYIQKTYGDKYLPEKPNFFSSSNKAAQEAHEAIRPTSLDYPPSRVKNALKPDQFRLYQIIWERFVACQMKSAEWDLTTVLIAGGTDQSKPCVFRASGRTLVFDGFYKVGGVPPAAETATLPKLEEQRPLHPFSIDAAQKFTSPPPRYSEASLIKALESEGIGRPSTYASIIQTIQDRKYVEQIERRLYATDLGEVVTDKLIEGFPRIMDVGYTREMEAELDKVEDDHLDWVDMLHRFYGPFRKALEGAEDSMKHAKAELVPAPPEYKCPDCGGSMVYRFGKSGRFMSCSTYPECKYACPVDRLGKPRPAEHADIACHKCGAPLIRRTGRFGPFLGCSRYGDEKARAKGEACDGILNIDPKGHVVAPSMPPLLTDLPCPKCQSPMNLRNGIRGPWLGCSRFPKCRGRGKWAEVPEAQRKTLEEQLVAHEKAHPVPIIKTLGGKPLTDAKGKPLPDAPRVDQLVEGVSMTGGAESSEPREELESAA
ncbi:MAG: type I DNA topoisomerase [Phycisphaeraceae bacterium]|nr:type I DNA topoisomerase [Phycisphaeraceae bacterium]